MSKIETSLMECGWEQSSSAPLVLHASLTHHIETTTRGADGRESRYTSLSLRRAGSRYAVVWSEWRQSEAGADKGFHSDESVEFDPPVDAVAVGYAHTMTVDIEMCRINFWTKPSGE